MGLFDIFKGKPQQATPKGQQNTQEPTGKTILQVTQTKGFKGYKKVNVTQHFGSDDTYYKNAAELMNKYGEYTNGATITIKYNENKKYCCVFVDDVAIGFIFDSNSYYDTFKNNLVESVVIKIENENVADGKNTTTRAKAIMFIKIKE